MTFVKSSKYMFLKKYFLTISYYKINLILAVFAMYFRSWVIILLWKLSSCLFKAFQQKKKPEKASCVVSLNFKISVAAEILNST